jgi:hypothetical protein
MDLELRRLVVQALDAVRVPHRRVAGGGLEVDLPVHLRTHFRGRSRLRLLFDEEVWRHDRDAELVTVGSPFLVGLETLLKETGPVSVLVGGEWFREPRAFEEWRTTFTLLNAREVGPHDSVHTDAILRFTYEITIPGATDRAELVTLAWQEGTGLLDPARIAELHRQRWYAPSEVGGVGGEDLPAAVLLQARSACEKGLRTKVLPVYEEELSAIRASLAEEASRVRDEARVRRAELVTPDRRQEIDEEERLRLERIGRNRDAGCRVVEQTLQIWRVARRDLWLDVARMGDGRVVRVPLTRNQAGRFRQDLCGGCTHSHFRYLVSPAEQTRLLCEQCGALCSAEGCPEVLSLQRPSSCPKCERPRFCASHGSACSACGVAHCPGHTVRASCCDAAHCPDHPPVESRDGRLLCRKHAATCAFDGQWTHVDDLVTCPLTGRVLFVGNAVTPRGDDRLLDPAAVVSCATTGELVARDRAGQCAVDELWHRIEHLETIDGEHVCHGHTTIVDVPPGVQVRSDRVQVCGDTSARLAPSAAETCSVRGRVYDRRLLVECPITLQWLHRAEAVSPPGDERMLHPSAVLRCPETGHLVARDRAIRDELAKSEVWLSPEGVVTCAISKGRTARSNSVVAACCGRQVAMPFAGRSPVSDRWWCREHGVLCEAHKVPVLPDEAVSCAISGRALCLEHTVAVECGRRVDPAHAYQLEGGTWGCDQHHRICSVRRRPYPVEQLVLCPLSGQWLHRDVAVSPPDDDRALHPEATVRCAASGVPVARDRAVRDELAGANEVWLHPKAVVYCAVSGKATQSGNVVTAACCGRSVGREFAGQSPISGGWWCRDHARLCVAHGVNVLPLEAVTCAISKRSLCLRHVVRAECGRMVSLELAYRLPDGSWGCHEHYSLCSVLAAPFPSGELVQCPVTKKWLHPSAAVRPSGDDRRLHPEAVVSCSESGRPVAKDRAIRDELSSTETLLAPEAAVKCAISGKWTRRSNTVVAACCQRQVSLPMAGRSALSSAWWCRDHVRRCSADAAPVLPAEVVTCPITHRVLCRKHTVTAECGRRVAQDAVYVLPDGSHGCYEHFGVCVGEHPTLRASLVACAVCGHGVCANHQGRDAYVPHSARCASHVRECRRCHMVATHGAGSVCVWCEAASPLLRTDHAWQAFELAVRPKLPWTTWLTWQSVQVSGTEGVRVIEVQSPLGNKRYRLTDGTNESMLDVLQGNTWIPC